ncbi:hypothetical protein D3C86_1296520 [compost metagenome]
MKHSCHLLVDFILGQFAKAQPKGNVVENIQVRKQGVALKHHVHAAFFGGQTGRILPIDFQRAGCRLFEACNDPHQGRLAAATWT